MAKSRNSANLKFIVIFGTILAGMAFLPAFAVADDPVARDYGDLAEDPVQGINAADVPAQVSPAGEYRKEEQSAGIVLLVDKVFQRKFYRAINFVRDGNFQGASDNFQDMQLLALEHGYNNLPEYSFELVHMAQRYSEEGNARAAVLLLSTAAMISPSHPRVHLLVASFWKVIGIDKALGHFGKAFSSIWDYPVLRWTLNLNIILLAFVGVTMALLAVCMIQFLRNGELLVVELGRRFSRTFRGVAGPGILALILIGPLFLGLFACLAVWSVTLTMLKRECRWLAVLSGVALMAWGFGMPFMARVGANLQSVENLIFEDVHNGNYVPSGEKYLLQEVAVRPEDPHVLFSVAQSLHRKGLGFEAQGVYQKVTEVVEERSPIHWASVLNLGVINYNDGRTQDAKNLFELLERRKIQSFELYYNLALIHLSLLDTANHRRYYELAKSYSKQRLDEFVAGGLEEAQALVGSPPAGVYAKRLLGAMPADEAIKLKLKERVDGLSSSALAGGSPDLIICLGLICLVSGARSLRKWGQERRKRPTLAFDESVMEETGISRLWCLLPGGIYLAGPKPVAGVFNLGIVIALIIAAFDAPVHLFPVLPLPVSFQSWLLVPAVILALGPTAWHLYRERKPALAAA